MNFKISCTIRVQVIGAGFVILESSLGVDGPGCGSRYSVRCVQDVVCLSEIPATIKVSHDEALASLHRAVRVKELSAHCGCIITFERGIGGSCVVRNSVSSRSD